MTNASNILNAIVPVSDLAPGGASGATPAPAGLAIGQSSEFAALLAGQTNAQGAQAALGAPDALQGLELPDTANAQAFAAAGALLAPVAAPNPVITDGETPAGNSGQLLPQAALAAPQKDGTLPVLPAAAQASNGKFAAAGDTPNGQPQTGLQALPETAKAQPAAPSAPVQAGLVEARQLPNGAPGSATQATAAQNAALPQEAPLTPAAMLQNAQAAADGRATAQAAQAAQTAQTAQMAQSAQAQAMADRSRADAAATNGRKAEATPRGPANALQQLIQRDEAANNANVTATARLAHSITANSSPMALNVSSGMVSNVAAPVPAGGAGAAATDTTTLMTSQTALQAQTGDQGLAGGGAGMNGGQGGGANSGGEFAANARATTVHSSTPPPATQNADFNQLVQQISATSGNAEQAFKTASTTSAATQGGSAQAGATPSEQIAIQIGMAARFGARQISLQLRPASLGEVNIDLNISNDGQVRATVLAERQETLDLLQRDARGLERALQDAGLKSDSGNLQFGLRGEGRDQRPQHQGDAYRAQAALMEAENEDNLPPAWAANAYNSATDRTLDIRV